MSGLKILSSHEISKFDNFPLLNDNQRHDFFSISSHVQEKLEALIAPENKIGFILQLGYFKATGKFYKEYNQDDKAFIDKQLGLNVELEGLNYSERTRLAHKKEVLDLLGYKPFNQSVDMFEESIANLVSKQMHPRKIIFSMVGLATQRNETRNRVSKS